MSGPKLCLKCEHVHLRLHAHLKKLKCPSCDLQSKIMDGQRVLCKSCSELNRSVFQFCVACRRKWPKDKQTSGSCTLPNCALRAALLSDTKITDSNSSVKGCPYFRACPGCKALLTHNGIGCPNITCPQCRTHFCFRCLRQRCLGFIDISFLPERQLLLLYNEISPCRIVDNKQSLTVVGL